MALDGDFALTRRRALQAGGAAAFLLLNPWVSAAASASDGLVDAPEYLVRSSWLGVSNKTFAVSGGTLRLEDVADLPAAANVASLRGSEDAFRLTFSGARLEQGIHEVRHSELGSFYVYVGQVGASGDERLEVIVNRLERSRRRAPKPPEPARSGGATGSQPSRPADEEVERVIRSITVRRAKRGAKGVAKLDAGADVRELTAWLHRKDRIVATTSRRVRRRRVEFNLRPAKRLHKGSYDVVVMAVDRDGRQSFKRKRVTLR